MAPPDFAELRVGDGAPAMDVEILRLLNLFRTTPQKRISVLHDFLRLFTNNCLEEHISEIIKLLVENNLFDIIREAFVDQIDLPLFKVACLLLSTMATIDSWKTVAPQSLRAKIAEHFMLFSTSDKEFVRVLAMKTLSHMVQTDPAVGTLLGGMLGVQKLIGKLRAFVEGERSGRRSIGLQEVCVVLSVIGQVITSGVSVQEQQELSEVLQAIEEMGMVKEEEDNDEKELWIKVGDEATKAIKRLEKQQGRRALLGKHLQKQQEKEEEIKMFTELTSSTSLDSIRVHIPTGATTISRHGNEVTHIGGAGHANLYIGEIMSRGVYHITFAFGANGAAYWPMLSLLDSSLGYPSQYDLSYSRTGVDMFCDGWVWNKGQSAHKQNEQPSAGDTWEMEVDLRSPRPEARTLHWFVRGRQQKVFVVNVPDKVEFTICTNNTNDRMQFVSFKKLPKPTVTQIDGEEPLNWA